MECCWRCLTEVERQSSGREFELVWSVDVEQACRQSHDWHSGSRSVPVCVAGPLSELFTSAHSHPPVPSSPCSLTCVVACCELAASNECVNPRAVTVPANAAPVSQKKEKILPPNQLRFGPPTHSMLSKRAQEVERSSTSTLALLRLLADRWLACWLCARGRLLVPFVFVLFLSARRPFLGPL